MSEFLEIAILSTTIIIIVGVVVITMDSEWDMTIKDLSNIPKENTDIRTPITTTTVVNTPDTYITNITTTITPSKNNTYNLTLRWEVENGVGCCNTFNCDKQLFYDNCVNPFKLYHVLFNNKIVNINEQTFIDNYECNYNRPWNEIYWNNLESGIYEILIRQTDCENIIDEKTVVVEI